MMNLFPPGVRIFCSRGNAEELRGTYPRVVGRVLRDMRRERGITLREAATRSAGTFKPSVLAAYERGERGISLERFHALANVYGISPQRLLAEVSRRLEQRPPDVVNVGAVRELQGPAAGTVRLFVERVMRLRGVRADTVTLRTGDLQVLSAAVGMSERDLRSAVDGTVGRTE
jgi:transcriptional regulator with XRE-family HTH domain